MLVGLKKLIVENRHEFDIVTLTKLIDWIEMNGRQNANRPNHTSLVTKSTTSNTEAMMLLTDWTVFCAQSNDKADEK